jgi:hypothetical protein
MGRGSGGDVVKTLAVAGLYLLAVIVVAGVTAPFALNAQYRTPIRVAVAATGCTLAVEALIWLAVALS